MHANQLTVSLQTVRKLVDEQFPSWRELPIGEVVSQGTVNALFRIGGKLLARFPLEPGDVESVRQWLHSEAQAARELLGQTRFPTPEPVALGESGAGDGAVWYCVESNPAMSLMGRRTLQRIMADASPS